MQALAKQTFSRDRADGQHLYRQVGQSHPAKEIRSGKLKPVDDCVNG